MFSLISYRYLALAQFGASLCNATRRGVVDVKSGGTHGVYVLAVRPSAFDTWVTTCAGDGV